MRFRALLWILAVLLLAGCLGEGYSEPYYGEDGNGYENENGEVVAVITLWFDDDALPDVGSVLELSEADAALTLAGTTTIEHSFSRSRFTMQLKVVLTELVVPYCFGDDVILNQNGVRSVVAPAGTVCITDLHFADPWIRVPIEAEN